MEKAAKPKKTSRSSAEGNCTAVRVGSLFGLNGPLARLAEGFPQDMYDSGGESEDTGCLFSSSNYEIKGLGHITYSGTIFPQMDAMDLNILYRKHIPGRIRSEEKNEKVIELVILIFLNHQIVIDLVTSISTNNFAFQFNNS